MTEPVVHNLKLRAQCWHEVASGRKNFAIVQEGGQTFTPGDLVALKEFADGDYTGRELPPRVITYVMTGPESHGALVAGYIVLALATL